MNQAQENATENPPVTRITVEPCGDWELWIAAGKLADNFEWRLPIKALPFKSGVGDRLYYVKCGMSCSAPQYNALSPVLDAWDCCPKDERGWWFKEASMKNFAVHAPGIHPEFYTVWPEYTVPKVNYSDPNPEDFELEPDPGFSALETEFLKRVHGLLGSIGWEELKIVWLAVRKEAKKFLVVDRRILDLGFVRLAYMPYRQNWKEALTIRFGALLTVFRKTPTDRHEALTEAGVYGALASAKLVAVDPKLRFVHWTLETLPSRELQHAVEEQEFAKLQKIGPASYANQILGAMSKRLKHTLEILRYYSGAVSLPVAKIREGGRFGSASLVPATEPGRVRPGKGICETLDLAPETAFNRFTDEAPPPEPREAPPLELPNFLKGIRSFRQLVENGELAETRRKRDGGVIIDLDAAVNPNPAPTQEGSLSRNNGAPTSQGQASNNHSRCSELVPGEHPAARQDGTDATPD
jgi:hypothetical protein